MKSKLVYVALLAMTVGTLLAVVRLQATATASRDAELQVSKLQVQLRDLQDIPWLVGRSKDATPPVIRGRFAASHKRLAAQLSDLRSEGVASAEMTDAAQRLERMVLPLGKIVDYASKGDTKRGSAAAAEAWTESRHAFRSLGRAGERYRDRAQQSLQRALYGSAAALAILFAAFALFFRRAARARRVAEELAAANQELLAVTMEQATTDALTGLGNRRALAEDLEAALETAGPGAEMLLAIFDLDGFKQYNDTFGHPAGDSLLARLGDRLAATVAGLGSAYRIGGDEFCVIAPVGADETDATVRLAAAALTEVGEAFEIRCSYGVTVLPRDASTAEEALGLADQRMYAQKAGGRASASRQATDALVRVLAERGMDLDDHSGDVARYAEQTARRLGLAEQDVQATTLAAELHDIGKSAIPDAILTKPGKLSEDEWAYMRQHTLIGERIVQAAPSLAHTAGLIRSSHERLDGGGYPDGLRGADIPLGSRIIAVCDAYDAMICDRAYRKGMPVADALAELRRCSGTQFDPEVVDAFEAILGEQPAARAAGVAQQHA